ncbi:hypothetical protein I316_02643 [Kwoniella heveanensis BCC8398]|uniref:Golgi apparatus membrane protein TVP38 n=1 Tax=Kwoniella heveanensis BCC8398 TaxID=1296120 RepID=A0A1B9GX26_9TREE|nr:hypothetical protein I316_02643 [Kwoniella heveanensis BCC8398]
MPRLETSPTRPSSAGFSLSPSDWTRRVDVRALLARARGLPRELVHRYHKLGRKGKYDDAQIDSGNSADARYAMSCTPAHPTFVPRFITFMHILMLALVIIVTPTGIGRFFTNLALRLKEMGWKGMVLCCLFSILSSHPPLFGFMGSLTLIGFTYGVWPGFLLSFISSMLGAGLSFLSVRAFFLGYISKNDKWDAFGHVMRAKGLPLVIMIRYCPIPWNIGNGLFASIESVKFWQFMLANLLIQPRLLIPVFIGSRLTSLASDVHDPLQTWLNLLSIAISTTISLVTGIVIYRLTLEQMRKLKNEEGELAAEYVEEDALLGELSDSDDEGDGIRRSGRSGGREEAELLTADQAERGRGGGAGAGGGRRDGKMVRRTSGSDFSDN